MIEFLNFILVNQDGPEQKAVLACMVDYEKAFNRQNHNLLITKLSDMGVPAWLLKVVIAFLSERNMTVRFRGAASSPKNLPGGCPQGTILGLFLFLILINDTGFKEQCNNLGEVLSSKKRVGQLNVLHLKFVDDLTIAESINLKQSLSTIPHDELIKPPSYHQRTGHQLLPDKSCVQKQLEEIEQDAVNNEMKINVPKTKHILFNQ